MAATITIDNAEEASLEVDPGIHLWYRTWGTRGASGIPVLFVHGGPGGCIARYENINQRFFAAERFFVVEVDQRGCGKSQPSVQNDHQNMQAYKNISIRQMAEDFEKIREVLAIDKWLVFGGSWGSCLGLEYALRFSHRCLGLILRGIFTNTVAEFEAIYARSSFLNNERHLKDFDNFFDTAASEARRKGEPTLDPNDARRIVQIYDDLHQAGDRLAVWKWYAFEENIVVESEDDRVDPVAIDESKFHHDLVQAVAFFEARLFLRGTYEEPIELLSRLGSLRRGGSPAVPHVPTWIVHGLGDEICPERFARDLEAGLQKLGVLQNSYFVSAGHRASSDGIACHLNKCVEEFETLHSTSQFSNPTSSLHVLCAWAPSCCFSWLGAQKSLNWTA
eukprot:TRINITY_DN63301_c0_g1_i1.p1 TRINITY_DN63301_c0_g1~~TRINITY_DN63301_c0_g1_i1.p1  ORF type:complete len:392 (+),score=47.89 TRINITY_DN63301_c0_g1_i1:70-1245(+)